MRQCVYEFNGVKLTEDQLFGLLLDTITKNPDFINIGQGIALSVGDVDYEMRLKHMIKIGTTSTSDIDKGRRESFARGEYLGVNDLIRLPSELDWDLWMPIYDESNYKTKYILNLVSKGMTQGEAEKDWEDNYIIELKFINGKGIGFHGLIQGLFHKKMTNKNFVYDKAKSELIDFIRNDAELMKVITDNGLTVDRVVSSIEHVAKQTFDRIMTTYKPKFIGSEMKVFLDAEGDSKRAKRLKEKLPRSQRNKKGITGVLDLVILDENNKIHIIDFKVSKHKHSEWGSEKARATAFLLGAYKRMLQAWGFDGDDIFLEVIPVVLNGELITDLSLDPDVISDSGIKPIEITSSIEGTEVGGKLSDTLYHSYRDTERKVSSSEVKDKIDKDIINAFGIKIERKLRNREFFLDKLKNAQELEKNGKRVRGLIDLTTGRMLYYTIEEWESEKLDDYLSRLEEFKNQYAITLYKKLVEAMNNNIAFKDIEYFPGEYKKSMNEALKNFFSKFDGAEVVDIPELLDMGVLTFRSELNGEEVLEFVNISDISPQTQFSLNGRHTILGNFMSDTAAAATMDNLLLPTAENIKGLEILLAINRIAQESGDPLFITKDGQPIRIKSINMFSLTGLFGESTTSFGIMDDYMKNALLLIREMRNAGSDVKNMYIRSIDNKDFPVIKAVLDVHSCIDYLVRLTLKDSFKDSRKANTKALADLITELADNPYRTEEKKGILLKCMKLIRQRNPSKYKVYDASSLPLLDIETDDDAIYWWANMLYLALEQSSARPDAGLADWNINLQTILRAIGGAFVPNKQFSKDSSGNTDTGFLGGPEAQSILNSPDETVRELMTWHNKAMSAVKTRALLIFKLNERLTTPYINKRRSLLYQTTVNDTTADYERFLVHTTDGKIYDLMMLLNPFSNECKLDTESKEYLANMLWQINKMDDKYTAHLLNLTWSEFKREFPEKANEIMDYSSNNSYFKLPLKRSMWRQLVLHHSTSTKDRFMNFLDRLLAEFTATDTVAGHPIRTGRSALTDMVNIYNITDLERAAILAANPDLYRFSFDLEEIANDVAFLYIRAKEFTPVLLHGVSLMTMIKMMLTNNPAVKYDDTMKRIEYIINTVIKGLSAIPLELLSAAKTVKAMLKLNSVAVLAFRPATFLKELVYGSFVNFSRAWALKGTSNQLSLESVTKAYAIIFGQSGKRFVHTATGSMSLDSWTVPRGLNKIYSFAAEDFILTTLNNSRSRFGIGSKWLYWLNSCPDYYNRMVLFIAKMIEDGCYDAHEIDDDGEMTYNWKKDKRFSELAKYGLNRTDIKSAKYKEQEALYYKIAEDLELEVIDPETGKHLKFIQYNSSTGRMELKDITKAYSSPMRDSLKEVADLAYGFYDHETRAPFTNKFIGLFYFQFLTFITAKWTQWFKATPKEKGKNTRQGHYALLKKDGKLAYIKPDVDAEGNWLGTHSLVYEGEVPNSELVGLLKAMYWEGEFVEGIVHSILHTLVDVCKAPFNKEALLRLKENPARIRNAMLGIWEILIGILLAWLVKTIFTEGTMKMKNMNCAEKVLYRAMTDVGPAAIKDFTLEPGFILTWSNMQHDVFALMSGEDIEFGDMLKKRVSAVKDFYYEPV